MITSFVTIFLTIALVVAGMKGPAWIQEDMEDALPWAVPALRFYAKPSSMVALGFGIITLGFTFSSVLPRWLAPWISLVFGVILAFLPLLFVRPSRGRPPLDQTSKDGPASAPQSARDEES